MNDYYKIELDKASTFECNIKVEGASLKKTKVNLIMESDDFSLKFKGDIDEDGKITVPLSKLKGVIDENKKGNLYLEVIADDTYFTPYETEYITEMSKKVEVVSVKNKKTPVLAETRQPKVTVQNVKDSKSNLILEHTKTIAHQIISSKLNISNSKDKSKILEIVLNYLHKHNINESINKDIIYTLFKVISKIKK